MIKKFILATLLFVLVVSVVAYVTQFRSPIAPPNSDQGADVQNGSFTCKEFADKSKNYAVGQVLIGFKPEVTFEVAQASIESIGASVSENDAILKGEIQIRKDMPFSLLVAVAPNQEQQFIEKFMQNPLVDFADLNHCNNFSIRVNK